MAEFQVDTWHPVSKAPVQSPPPADLGQQYAVNGSGSPANQADQTNPGWRGLKVVIDITANAGGLGSATVTIQGKDKASGKYYTILQSAALAAVATTVLTVFPGAAVAANLSANDQLPEVFRIIAAGNANPITYTVGACGLI